MICHPYAGEDIEVAIPSTFLEQNKINHNILLTILERGGKFFFALGAFLFVVVPFGLMTDSMEKMCRLKTCALF